MRAMLNKFIRRRQEQERFRQARQRELALIQSSMATANPRYVIEVTGFWLERWRGKRSVMRGRRRECAA